MKTIKIEDLEREIGKDIAAFRNGIADNLQKQIIENAPVDEGTMRANIKTYVNDVNGDFDKSSQDPSGTATQSSNSSTIKGAVRPEDRIIISSHAPYSVRVEFEGHSGDAPTGFVRIALDSLQSIVQNVKQNINNWRQP